MKDKVFKYKGQLGSVEPDLTRQYLYGKLLFINDLIMYEAATIPELEQEFRAAVDEYLEDCAELGVEPNTPCKGSFNVRVGEDLHRRLAVRAAGDGKSLNEACIEAIELYLDGPANSVIEHIHNHKHTHTYHQVPERFEFEGVDFGIGNWQTQARRSNLITVKGVRRGLEWQS